MDIIIKRINAYYAILLIAVFYLFFPTSNSSLDAYGYAGYIEYGESLFSPHHLIYNAFLYLIIQPIKSLIPKIDVLSISKIINSIFLIFNLIILTSILKKLKLNRLEIFLLLLIAGFSFNSWRFGTENETYVIPITFSLLGSLYFLKYLDNKHIFYIFLSGLFSTISILFHQIHFLWWFGLLLGLLVVTKRFKTLISYSISALLVPFIYMLVIVYYNNQELSIDSILRFFFHDYYSGVATSNIGWKNLLLIGVSTVRTFFQVHPTIIFLLKKNLLFFLPILFFLSFVTIIIRKLFKNTLYKKRKNINRVFLKTHITILIIHFIFAFYAVGNVEFLVMIPFLMILSLFYIFQFNQYILLYFSLTLFVWNFSYGIFPNNQYKYYNDEILIDFIIAHPNDTFIVNEPRLINMYYYKTGIDNYNKILLSNNLNPIDVKSDFIYTEIIDRPEVFNRAKIVTPENNRLKFKDLKKEKVFSYTGLYGKTSIYKIHLK